MFCRDITAVKKEEHMKRTNTLRGQNAGFPNATEDDIYSYHRALTLNIPRGVF